MKYIIYVMAIISLMLMAFFNFVLYPLKYKKEIKLYSEKYGVESALVASVIATESSFNISAESSKGAIGLMQLLPSTAEWICELIGEEFSKSKLYNSDFNIRLGTYYLKYLITKFNDTDLAIIAYNAGEGTLNLWLKNSEYSDGKTLKVIPYKETKNYLTKVNRGVVIYRERI